MKMIVKILIAVLVVLIVGFFLMRWLLPANSPRPDGLGVENGRLSPCPDSPNCVSSLSTSETQGMEPLTYDGDVASAHQRVIAAINGYGGATIITDQPDYIYAEFRTPLLRLIDDVEFLFDEENKLIHFRSASRLGYSDMEANRNRMTALIEAING